MARHFRAALAAAAALLTEARLHERAAAAEGRYGPDLRRLADATTTTPPCALAGDPCSCAAASEGCTWATNAAGGGSCLYRAGLGVDCVLCALQPSCGGQSCSAHSSACACADASTCRWDLSSGCVQRVSDNDITPCSACPSQSHCPKVEALHFNPGDSALAEFVGELQIIISFNVALAWCDALSGGAGAVSFGCDGQVMAPQVVARDDVALTAYTLRADVTSLVKQLVRTGQRQCGLIVQPSMICDRSNGIPWSGVAQGAYKFLLSDSVAPSIVDFDPMNGGSGLSPVDGAVTIQFNEAVTWSSGPTPKEATLGRVEVDTTGRVTTVQSEKIPLAPPQAFVLDEQWRLRIELAGKVTAGRLYTLSLPEGAVEDFAGNRFPGLLPHTYTFRARTVHASNLGTLDDAGDGGGVTTLMIIVGVSSVVTLLGTAAIGVSRAMRASEKTAPQPTQTSKVPVVPKAWTPGAHIGGARSDSYKPSKAAGGGHDAQRPYRVNVGPSSSSARGSPGPAGTPKASGGPPNMPGPGGSSSRPEARKPSNPPQVPAKPQAQAAEDSARPEVKAVAKQLRDAMDKPLPERKKALKELMLEYHPDKNHGDHAKDVFQYVNNAKSWFLQE